MPNSTDPMIETLNYGSAETVDISTTDHQFARPVSGLFVGFAGDVVLDMGSDGNSITFTANAGVILPLFIKTIKKAGTTAAGLVGLR